MRPLLKTLLLLLGIPLAAMAKGGTEPGCCYEKADSITVERLLKAARGKAIGHPTLYFARQFLDVPYVAKTLELFPDEERLIVNTRQLDCTTLVETALALALCHGKGQTDFADYCRQLRLLRYRSGRIDGYTSRLHYFTDWILDNTAMGLVREVAAEGDPFDGLQKVETSFMSRHADSYPALKAHPELVEAIARQERNLTGRTFRFVTKQRMASAKSQRKTIADGDVIAIVTNKKGLDIAHLGFAEWKSDGLHLLNASQIHHKVVSEPMLLSQYLKQHPTHLGIRIVRLLPDK